MLALELVTYVVVRLYGFESAGCSISKLPYHSSLRSPLEIY